MKEMNKKEVDGEEKVPDKKEEDNDKQDKDEKQTFSFRILYRPNVVTKEKARDYHWTARNEERVMVNHGQGSSPGIGKSFSLVHLGPVRHGHYR